MQTPPPLAEHLDGARAAIARMNYVLPDQDLRHVVWNVREIYGLHVRTPASEAACADVLHRVEVLRQVATYPPGSDTLDAKAAVLGSLGQLEAALQGVKPDPIKEMIGVAW